MCVLINGIGCDVQVRKLWGSASAVTATNGQALVSNLLQVMHTRQGSGGDGTSDMPQQEGGEGGQREAEEGGEKEEEGQTTGEGEGGKEEGERGAADEPSKSVQVTEVVAEVEGLSEGSQAVSGEGQQAPQTVDGEKGEEGGQQGLEPFEEKAAVTVDAVDV